MPAHFAAVNGIFLPHPGFDKGVSGFADDRLSAVACDDFEGIPD